MNILYTGFSKGLAEVPEYLKKKLSSIENVHLVVNSEHEIKTECKNYFLTRNCQLGQFTDVIKYSDIPLDEEFLTEMSKCESTVLKMMDRYQFTKRLLTYEERINLYHKQLKFWYNYLVKEKINVCVFAVLPHVVYDFTIYSLCKHLGINTFMLYRLPVLPQKNVSIYVLKDINEHIPGLRASYEKHLNSTNPLSLTPRMSAYLDLKEGNENKTFRGIVSSSKNFSKYFQIGRYLNYIKYKVFWLGEWIKLWGDPIDIFYRLIYSLSMVGMDKPVYTVNPDLTCKFIFVSLHYQPECTTCPMGGAFVHQDLMIDILMKAVPSDVKLYIKPHPREGMSKKLFRRLHIDSRIVFINPELNSFKLITNSLAIATVTGTAGWEGFLNNKPILMFGSYFYQDAPNVFKIKTVVDTIDALKEILYNKKCTTDQMLMAFLKAVDENSFPGWVDSRYSTLSGLTIHENCTNIANALSLAIPK